MTVLVREANQDKTRKARKELYASVGEFINDKIRDTGVNVLSGDYNLKLAQVENLFKNKKIRKALEVIYTDEQMETLARLRDDLRELDFIAKGGGGGGAPSFGKEAETGRRVSASIFGIVRGRGVFAISDYILERLGRNPRLNAKKVIDKALFDPEAAALLLRDDTAATRDIINNRLKSYIANNLNFEEDDGSPIEEDNSTPEPPDLRSRLRLPPTSPSGPTRLQDIASRLPRREVGQPVTAVPGSSSAGIRQRLDAAPVPSAPPPDLSLAEIRLRLDAPLGGDPNDVLNRALQVGQR